jgi:hypothetical protein
LSRTWTLNMTLTGAEYLAQITEKFNIKRKWYAHDTG